MNSQVKKKLSMILKANDKEYPKSAPIQNDLGLHIEIYELINEYEQLFNDMQNATGATKSLIEPRLKEIEYKLTHYWIVKDEDMVVTKPMK